MPLPAIALAGIGALAAGTGSYLGQRVLGPLVATGLNQTLKTVEDLIEGGFDVQIEQKFDNRLNKKVYIIKRRTQGRSYRTH